MNFKTYLILGHRNWYQCLIWIPVPSRRVYLQSSGRKYPWLHSWFIPSSQWTSWWMVRIILSRYHSLIRHKIFYLKLLVIAFMIAKYIFNWSPGFSITRKISQFTAIVTRIYVPHALRYCSHIIYTHTIDDLYTLHSLNIMVSWRKIWWNHTEPTKTLTNSSHDQSNLDTSTRIPA